MVEHSLLISADIVVRDSTSPPLSPGYVVVDDGRIVEVGRGRPSGISAEERIELDNSILIPGLISSHDHMYGVLAHGIPVKKAPKGFWEFLDEFWWPYVENRLDKEMIRAASYMAAVERLKTGTTCVGDILEAPNSIPGALDVEAKAVEEVGLRAVLSFEATERISEENGKLGLEENLRFIKNRNRKEGLVKGMHCIHTTFTCSPEFIRECREQANQTGAGIHIHFEEGPYESEYCLRRYGKLPALLYEELGFWGGDVLASQCVQTRAEEIEILARHGVKASHQPLSNGEVGGGIAPIPDMVERGILVGLGTDGFIVDMFEVMRTTWLIHKSARVDASVMPADLVFRMATENGGRILGVKAGRIEEGYRADMVLVRNRFPTPVTEDNVITQLVVYGSGNLVDTVIVDGRVVVRNGKMERVNEERIRQDCIKAAEKLWSGVGE